MCWCILVCTCGGNVNPRPVEQTTSQCFANEEPKDSAQQRFCVPHRTGSIRINRTVRYRSQKRHQPTRTPLNRWTKIVRHARHEKPFAVAERWLPGFLVRMPANTRLVPKTCSAFRYVRRVRWGRRGRDLSTRANWTGGAWVPEESEAFLAHLRVTLYPSGIYQCRSVRWVGRDFCFFRAPPTLGRDRKKESRIDRNTLL